MNAFGFIGLLRSIYGKELPDLKKIQDKGLLAVKIAQHYALRIDFLDEKVCRHLARLYRNTLTLPAEDLQSLIDSHTPDGWMDNFSLFDDDPLASASIGQVHAARLKTSGEPVVVKVIKKDFRAEFLKDIAAVRRLFKFVLFFYPTLHKVFDPLGILAHIEDYTITELDLRNEISGQQTLKDIHDKHKDEYDLSGLRFHRFYPELSGPSVLVAERVTGRTFDELLTAGELPYERLLELFHIHGFFMFGPGIFHGDIHPGNIFLDADGKICFIDTSAVSTIGPKIRQGLYRFMEALSAYDYDKCADSLNRMANHEISGQKFDRFKKKMLVLYEDFTDSTVAQVSLTKKMMQTIKLGVNSGMVFEEGMFAIIKSMMYLDGMVLRCNPRAVLMKDMRAFIGEFNRLQKGFTA